MAFLLGAFGARCNDDYIKKISSLALRESAFNSLSQTQINHGIVFAGKKSGEIDSGNVIPLTESAGFVVGKLFDKATYAHVRFDAELTRSVLSSSNTITEKLWGRYVGALFNKNNQTMTLVRDPQGLSSLFYVISIDGIVFASDLKLLYDALEIKPSLDLNYFAEHLIHTNHALPITPLQDVRELLPGMALTIKSDGTYSQELLWDVSSIKSCVIDDTDAFESLLLATLRSCVKAWAAEAPGVCVELSGGTDSSGVMLLLRDILPATTTLHAVNFIDSKTPSSNEIVYAQEIANDCKASLHFIDWQTVSLLDQLPHNWFPNKPSTLMLFHNMRQQIHQYVEQHNCSVIMNGQGGDHVFLSPSPKHAVADYWLDQGMRGIAAPLRAISGVYRAPLSAIVYDAAKSILNYYRGGRYEEVEPMPFFDRQFFSTIKCHEFYLTEKIRNFYPGKAVQIENLHHAISYCERDNFPMTITHPLLSQPIVELALSIPTFQSFAHGYDRIFFRNAVDRAKKTTALWRRIKGQTTSSMAKACAHHAHDIREIIVSGTLFKAGILDKQWVEIELGKMRHGYVENLWPILHILTSERWIHAWNM